MWQNTIGWTDEPWAGGPWTGSSTNPATNRFIFDITTSASPQTFTIPTTSGIGNSYNCTVYWGDGSSSVITAYDDADRVHSYATAGNYTIEIDGTITGFRFNNGGNKTLLKDVKNWGRLKLTDESGAFYGCANMTVSATDAFDISLIVANGCQNLFRNCANIVLCRALQLINTAAVTNMYCMFCNCSAFNQSVANFNTAAVINMTTMFFGCSAFNQSVANFNTAAVINMYGMFYNCSAFNQSVANFNTAAVTNMYSMFYNCSAFNQSLSGFTIAALNAVGNLNNFLAGGELSTVNYDALLIAWEGQVEPINMTPHFGTSKYTAGGAAAAARAALVANGWTITDGGVAP